MTITAWRSRAQWVGVLLVGATLTIGPARAATVFIDFESFTAGAYNPGDILGTVGPLTVSIPTAVTNPQGGTVLTNGAALGGSFAGNYLSSVGGANDGRVDLQFSTAILGLITFDASYDSTAGLDFQVIDLLTGSVVHSEIDGPNNKQISFNLVTPTTLLRFRDSDLKSVHIDNLEVTAVPLPAALPLFVAGLATLGFFGRWTRRRS